MKLPGDGIKLALLGFRHLVEVWCLPFHPEWAASLLGLPNWVLGWTHGLRVSAQALGAGTKVLRRLWVIHFARGRRPTWLVSDGRVSGLTTSRPLAVAVERLSVVGVLLRKLPGVDACEFMRTGWAPPFGLSFSCFALERLSVSSS